MPRSREWGPLRKFPREWPPLNPRPMDPTEFPFIPEASISAANLVGDIPPEKIQLRAIKVYNASAANTIADATDTAVNFDSVAFNQGFTTPSGTFTTVTIPATGAYMMVGVTEWASGNGSRKLWLYIGAKKEGVAQSSDASAILHRLEVTGFRRMTAGDTVGLYVRQDQSPGAALAITAGEENTSLTVVFLGTV